MGFLDNALKKVGAALASRIGIVISGEYEGCGIVFGNPPKHAVSTSRDFSQIIFLDDNEEVARFTIAEDIESIEYTETIVLPKTGNNGLRCTINFSNGDSCEVDLYPSVIYPIYYNLRRKMSKETCAFLEEEFDGLPKA